MDISYKIFERAFVEKRTALERLARYIIGNDEDAKDIVSKCYLSLWEHHERIDNEKIYAYLFTSIKNACLDYRRAAAVHNRVLQEMLTKEGKMVEYYNKAIESCDPTALFAGEMTGIMRATVNMLPEQQRKTFLLNRVDGLSYKETAEALGITSKRVDKNIQKVLKRLRAALREYLPVIILALMAFKTM